MPGFDPVASSPVAAIAASSGFSTSTGSIALGIDVVGVGSVIVLSYSTDVTVCFVMSGADVVSVFCTLEPPAVVDTVVLLPLSDADVTSAMVLCCTC